MNNNDINEGKIKVLKEVRNKTGKYIDIPDKVLIELIEYAIEEIKAFGALGINSPNTNDLPNNLSEYRIICSDLIKDLQKFFFKD